MSDIRGPWFQEHVQVVPGNTDHPLHEERKGRCAPEARRYGIDPYPENWVGGKAVDPDSRQIVVSKRIREEFENGRKYYALQCGSG